MADFVKIDFEREYGLIERIELFEDFKHLGKFGLIIFDLLLYRILLDDRLMGVYVCFLIICQLLENIVGLNVL